MDKIAKVKKNLQLQQWAQMVTERQSAGMTVAQWCGFLTIRMDDTTVLDFIKYAARYFVSTQQYFEWRAG